MGTNGIRRAFAAAFAGLGALLAGAAGAAEPEWLRVPPGSKLVVFAPHPDDESLCCAGLLQAALAGGGSARVVTFTAGDGYVEAVQLDTGEPQPRPAEYVSYGQKRIGELRAAVRVLGGDAIRVDVLGYPDGGLQPLLHAHWRHGHPERSATTRQEEVPYVDAPDVGARYTGADLLAQVLRVLRETEPTVVALPDPLDAHPDHSATGLVALLALTEWLGAGAPHVPADAPFPLVLAYLVHYPPWPPGWAPGSPPPLPGAERTRLELPPSLPPRGWERVLLPLGPEEIARKGEAIARHETQQHVMPAFLRAFVRSTEPFSVLRAGDLDRVAELVERDIAHAKQQRAARRAKEKEQR